MNLYESIKENLKEDEKRDKRIEKNENLFNLLNKYFKRDEASDNIGNVYGTRVDNFVWTYGPLEITATDFGQNYKIDSLTAYPKNHRTADAEVPYEVYKNFPNYKEFSGILLNAQGKTFTEDEIVQYKNMCDEFIDSWNKELNLRQGE